MGILNDAFFTARRVTRAKQSSPGSRKHLELGWIDGPAAKAFQRHSDWARCACVPTSLFADRSYLVSQRKPASAGSRCRMAARAVDGWVACDDESDHR